MEESPTTGLRFDALVRALNAQAATDCERRRLANLVDILTQALPPDLVALAYRLTSWAA